MTVKEERRLISFNHNMLGTKNRKWVEAIETHIVGFPSVCCDYHWLIKGLLWACSRAMGKNLGR